MAVNHLDTVRDMSTDDVALSPRAALATWTLGGLVGWALLLGGLGLIA